MTRGRPRPHHAKRYRARPVIRYTVLPSVGQSSSSILYAEQERITPMFLVISTVRGKTRVTRKRVWWLMDSLERSPTITTGSLYRIPSSGVFSGSLESRAMHSSNRRFRLNRSTRSTNLYHIGERLMNMCPVTPQHLHFNCHQMSHGFSRCARFGVDIDTGWIRWFFKFWRVQFPFRSGNHIII